MTIEERAKDFADYNNPSSQDIVTTAMMIGKYDGFKAGAEWMLNKTIDWICDKDFNTAKYTINIEELIRAMEE